MVLRRGWKLASSSVLALATGCASGLNLSPTLEDIDPIPIEPAEPTGPTEMSAGRFRASALESRGESAPFSFTLFEGETARAQIRCIWSQSLVCSGDEGFLFYMRIPKATDEAPAPPGELTIETVRFELVPQLGPADPRDGLIQGYEIRGPSDAVAAIESRAPKARFWLAPGLAASLRRAVAATAFALRLQSLLRVVVPPPQSQLSDSP